MNTLVLGTTGVGKSSLINNMMGRDVAEVGHGAKPLTSRVEVHEGSYNGATVKVYDTFGFGEDKGKSEQDTFLEIAGACDKFNLVLICIKFDSKIDSNVINMFQTLGQMMHEDMWKRSIIVLTFANFHSLAYDLSPDSEADTISDKVEVFKSSICSTLSNYVGKEIYSEIPFCIAGYKREKKLPTVDDWLGALWEKCVSRCSYGAHHLLKQKYLIQPAVVRAGTGVAIGAVVGSIATVIVGPIGGAIVGSTVGGVVSSGGVYYYMKNALDNY